MQHQSSGKLPPFALIWGTSHGPTFHPAPRRARNGDPSVTSDLLARADALIAHVTTGRSEPGGTTQIEALALCVLANCPVLLRAGPGVDRSAVMHQIAVALDVPLEVLIASIHVEPAAVPDWAVRIIQAGRGILLLDEVSSAPPATQTALLRVALERRVGGLVLPPAARVVTAVNSPSAGDGGWYLPAPLANRFVHLDWTSCPDTAVGGGQRVVIPQVASQHAAAVAARARELVSGFLTASPTFAQRVPDDPRADQAWPSPRTWEMVCRLLALGLATGTGKEAMAAAIHSAVGRVAGLHLLAYVDGLDLPELAAEPMEPAPVTLLSTARRRTPSVRRSSVDAGTVLAETCVRVLGPVQVTGPGGLARLGGAIPRALLGLLALRTGLVVPAESLIDALWGEDAPRTARRTLQSHVCRLRRALDACGLPDALVTREPGYALTLPPQAVDALRFIDAVRNVEDDGSEKSVESVSKLLDEALELWRGDPFDGHDLFDWAVGEVARLRELRVSTIERLWECEVLTGGHAQAIPELERLVTVYPLRERLWELLIVALNADSRRADALAAYQRVRRTLVDELGVEPGAALRRCHSMVLAGRPG